MGCCVVGHQEAFHEDVDCKKMALTSMSPTWNALIPIQIRPPRSFCDCSQPMRWQSLLHLNTSNIDDGGKRIHLVKEQAIRHCIWSVCALCGISFRWVGVQGHITSIGAKQSTEQSSIVRVRNSNAMTILIKSFFAITAAITLLQSHQICWHMCSFLHTRKACCQWLKVVGA